MPSEKDAYSKTYYNTYQTNGIVNIEVSCKTTSLIRCGFCIKDMYFLLLNLLLGIMIVKNKKGYNYSLFIKYQIFQVIHYMFLLLSLIHRL